MSTTGPENINDRHIGKSSHDDRKASHDSEKKLDQAIAVPVTELPVDEFPDGGFRAWLVVFGVCSTSNNSITGNLTSLGNVHHVYRLRLCEFLGVSVFALVASSLF